MTSFFVNLVQISVRPVATWQTNQAIVIVNCEIPFHTSLKKSSHWAICNVKMTEFRNLLAIVLLIPDSCPKAFKMAARTCLGHICMKCNKDDRCR